jgi:hypothetical protein
MGSQRTTTPLRAVAVRGGNSAEADPVATHLREASRALACSVPALSAHLGSRCRAACSAAGAPPPSALDSCSLCGLALLPGATCRCTRSRPRVLRACARKLEACDRLDSLSSRLQRALGPARSAPRRLYRRGRARTKLPDCPLRTLRAQGARGTGAIDTLAYRRPLQSSVPGTPRRKQPSEAPSAAVTPTSASVATPSAKRRQRASKTPLGVLLRPPANGASPSLDAFLADVTT